MFRSLGFRVESWLIQDRLLLPGLGVDFGELVEEVGIDTHTARPVSPLTQVGRVNACIVCVCVCCLCVVCMCVVYSWVLLHTSVLVCD